MALWELCMLFLFSTVATCVVYTCTLLMCITSWYRETWFCWTEWDCLTSEYHVHIQLDTLSHGCGKQYIFQKLRKKSDIVSVDQVNQSSPDFPKNKSWNEQWKENN